MYGMRFDFRSAPGGVATSKLHRAALDMAEWAEAHDGAYLGLAEHHGDSDGYNPSPLLMAAAFAARTNTMTISVAIFMLPLYNPVRLAEEMCVLDNLSHGRMRFIGGIGYVPSEYELHGVDFGRRGKIAEEYLEVLLKAVTGEEFEYAGRRGRVTPAPLTPGGPRIGWGGGSLAAARRAGKHGIEFLGQRDDPALREAYDQACAEFGKTPGDFHMSRADEPAVMFVAEDVDAAWDEIGPYMLRDVVNYARWYEDEAGQPLKGLDNSNSISFAKTVNDLRGENRSHLILSVDQAIERVRAGHHLRLHPLIGGIPPEIAWRYLRTVGEKVAPAARK